jgi:cytochrome c oxidase subunit 2
MMTNSRATPMILLARLVAALLLFALGSGALAQGADASNPAADATAAAEQAAPASAMTQSNPYSPDMGPISRMFFPSASSTHARETDAIMFFIFWVSVFFFVLLMGLTVYFTVKYRRRPGVPQERSLSHNTPLELTWSIIPTLLMAVMFVWGFKVYMEMHVVPAGAETINVTAQKWAWNFEYDDGSSSRQMTDPILGVQYPVYAVPVGRPVRLLMQSQDVIHSLYVPAFRHKIDVFPNRYTVYNFTATEVGNYQLFCAEYCGDQHSQMMVEIRVMTDSDYRAWRAEQSNTDDIPLPDLGETLRLTKGCAQCHTVDGTAGTGPSWKDIFGATHEFTDGTKSVVDENYLRESILYPGNKLVVGYPNQMPSYAGQLKEREIRAIIAYIASLSADGQGALEQMMEQDEAGKEAMEPAGPDAAAPSNADNALAATSPN